jgi:hypothetical protein
MPLPGLGPFLFGTDGETPFGDPRGVTGAGERVPLLAETDNNLGWATGALPAAMDWACPGKLSIALRVLVEDVRHAFAA